MWPWHSVSNEPLHLPRPWLELATQLGRAVTCPRGLDEALATGWVCYQPELMFPHDDPAGLEFFADWALSVCERTPGVKLFAFDEAQRYLSPNLTPPCLRTVVNRGRRSGLDVTHRAADLNVKQVVDAGVLREQGAQTYNRMFVAHEVMEILDASEVE